MKTLTVREIKEAFWDVKFRNLFPDQKERFEEFLADPDCACNMKLTREVMKHKDKLEKYFPNKEIDFPDEVLKNEWGVINCPIKDLEDIVKKLPHWVGIVAVSRFKDEITVVTNDIEVQMRIDYKRKNKFKVINTNIAELSEQLKKNFPEGKAIIAIARYEEKVTLVVEI